MTVYSSIETIVPVMGGWCSIKKAQHLASLIHAVRGEVTVEIGVHGGRSCIPMAMMHRALAFGSVMAVDAWKASASIMGQSAADQAYWGNQANHDSAKASFLQWIQNLRLEDFIKVVEADSNTVAPPASIGVLHIDGNHGPQTIKDVERFAPHVMKGGFCVMDDLNWSNKGPAQAAELLAPLGFRTVVKLKRNFETNTHEKDDYGVYQRL